MKRTSFSWIEWKKMSNNFTLISYLFSSSSLSLSLPFVISFPYFESHLSCFCILLLAHGFHLLISSSDKQTDGKKHSLGRERKHTSLLIEFCTNTDLWDIFCFPPTFSLYFMTLFAWVKNANYPAVAKGRRRKLEKFLSPFLTLRHNAKLYSKKCIHLKDSNGNHITYGSEWEWD